MADPHAPYFSDILTALGDNADPADSWHEYCNDNGEVTLAEIYIQLDPDRADTAGYPDGLSLIWNQVTGWMWAWGTPDGRLSDPDPLVLALIATPATIATAAQALLSGENELPLTGEEAPPSAYPALDELPRGTADDEYSDI
ncbi:hypothetical protein [Kitasatospora sp. NPDC008115]|uniref:hypothetical protein n=1 Tax=Kitasatospora sp. NPDC008115 TaxID=3364022 RepID=UPI0036F09DC6